MKPELNIYLEEDDSELVISLGGDQLVYQQDGHGPEVQRVQIDTPYIIGEFFQRRHGHDPNGRLPAFVSIP